MMKSTTTNKGVEVGITISCLEKDCGFSTEEVTSEANAESQYCEHFEKVHGYSCAEEICGCQTTEWDSCVECGEDFAKSEMTRVHKNHSEMWCKPCEENFSPNDYQINGTI